MGLLTRHVRESTQVLLTDSLEVPSQSTFLDWVADIKGLEQADDIQRILIHSSNDLDSVFSSVEMTPQRMILLLELSPILLLKDSLYPVFLKRLSVGLQKSRSSKSTIILLLHSDALWIPSSSSSSTPSLHKSLQSLFRIHWTLSKDSLQVTLDICQKKMGSGRVWHGRYRNSLDQTSHLKEEGGWVLDSLPSVPPVIQELPILKNSIQKNDTKTTTSLATKKTTKTPLDSGLTFRLSLSETEAEARAALTLPHTTLIPSSTSSSSSSSLISRTTDDQDGPVIHYDHDEGDALDDEDPDEDLDI